MNAGCVLLFSLFSLHFHLSDRLSLSVSASPSAFFSALSRLCARGTCWSAVWSRSAYQISSRVRLLRHSKSTNILVFFLLAWPCTYSCTTYYLLPRAMAGRRMTQCMMTAMGARCLFPLLVGVSFHGWRMCGCTLFCRHYLLLTTHYTTHYSEHSSANGRHAALQFTFPLAAPSRDDVSFHGWRRGA